MTRPAGVLAMSASMDRNTTSKALVAPSMKKHSDMALADPWSIGKDATKANNRKAAKKPVSPSSRIGRRPMLSAISPSKGPEKACTNNFIATNRPSWACATERT